MAKDGFCSTSLCKMEECDTLGSGWYFSRKEIEEKSPSRRDGIDLKKEAYLRKSYCTFLQNVGIRLKVPQVMIATAIVFCHRFFLRQSHAKNDWRTIATVCMFLAGKVEETPRQLKDVIIVSYEIIHKKDPSAVQKIKHKEVYEQQKELILLGERVVLTTLDFDFNVHHPYKPLVDAIKKVKVTQDALVKVAWNFVNDGLRTSLCLQFKAPQLAAGAIFLATKFLKVMLPSDGDKVWWQEFDVTQRQLEEISNQMLDLYDQNRLVQSSDPSEVGAGATQPAKTSSTVHEKLVSVDVVTLSKSTQSNGRAIGRREWKDQASQPKSGDAISKIDKDKMKAAIEKGRKSRNVKSKKIDIMDVDDLIEMELENGIEMATVSMKCDKINHGFEEEVLEDGELSSLIEQELHSPKLQKNEAMGWLDSERANKRPRCEIRG